MKKRRLGKSGIAVSELCLGTMTFGSSCDEKEAFRIMDRAVDAGIDFFDTAEIYPIPPEEKYVYETERIVGRWLKGKPRDSIFIATKVAGPGHGWFVPPVRHGKTALDMHSIRRAVEGSLQRLGTDYIDLYQTHWPDPDFGYEETLAALTELRDEGLIRIAGSSNETPWGAMKAEAVAKQNGFIRYETIQNNFSINNRRFEDALAEICRREAISLIPFSPLAGGVLTGKYNTSESPANVRFTTYQDYPEARQREMASRFVNDKTLATVERLIPIAKAAGISLTELAIAWSKQHDFVASSIFGVNTVDQLEDIIEAVDIELSPETLSAINAVSAEIPYPMG